MAQRRKKAPRPARPQEQPHKRQPKDWQWWIVGAAVPLVLCASKLTLDLWSDEAYTLIFFVSKPFAQIATDYSAPNNHVFYSLLLRPFWLLSDSNVVLRLPSFLFTAGTLAMVFRLARRSGGAAAAVLATLWLGLTQMFLVHTMQVRGYGLSMFLAAWLGDLALAKRTSWPQQLGIGLVGAAFLYTIPTNALFLAPLAVAAVAWAAVRDRSWRLAAVAGAGWIAACAAAGLAYLPIAGQVFAARGEPAAMPPGATFALARHILSDAARDWLLVLPLAAVGLICWARKVRRQPSREQAALPLLVAVMLMGPFLVTTLLGLRPFPRNYCPILPFLAVAIGWTLAELGTAAGRLLRSEWTETATGLAGMVVLAAVALPRIATYPARLTEFRRSHFAQDGYYDYYAANFHPAQVVAYLQATIPKGQGYLVCFADTDHFVLVHYFARAGLPWERYVEGSSPVVYTITPELVDYEALSARFGLSADELRRLPLVRDFGYYQLRCSGGPLGKSTLTGPSR